MSAYHLDNPISGPTNGKHRFVEGSSSVLRALQRVIERVANTDLPVLIIGEPGSGKRSVAWELHRQSEFAGGGFHEFAAAEFAQKMLHANSNGGLHGVGGEEAEDAVGDEVRLFEHDAVGGVGLLEVQIR